MKKIILTAVLGLLASVSINLNAQEENVQTFAFPNDSLAQRAVTPALADSAYIQEDYLTAIAMYEEIIATQGVSAALYMNLGNAYFKTDEIAKAILNYERAYLIDPSDKDLEFNLEYARTKIVDKETVKNNLFIVTWYRKLCTAMDVNQWAVCAIILFFLAMAALGICLMGHRTALRKLAFGLSVAFVICTVLALSFAGSQRKSLMNRETAIIMTPSVTVKSTPSENGTDLFIVHEGRKVNIIDNSMKEWVEIELSDGNNGWIPLKSIEII